VSIINRTAVLLFAALFAATPESFAQCCSTGSPVGATVYVGILARNNLRVATYFRHSYSSVYYEGTTRTDENVPLNYSSYNFAGLAVGYGVTRRLTLEYDMGYFFDKQQDFQQIDYTEKGFGFSNAGLGLKYGCFVNPARQIEFTAGAGFRFPFTTTPQEIDGVQLSRDVQPSTNAFALNAMLFLNKGWTASGIRLFSLNRFEYNFPDKQQYQYGSVLLNSLFLSKKIFPRFFGILQCRSEWRFQDSDHDVKRANSGNYLLILSPQISYSIAGKWNLSLLYDFPVYKNYQGKQLTPKYSFAVSLTRDIDLNRNKPSNPAENLAP
jgi:hypothetical protein